MILDSRTLDKVRDSNPFVNFKIIMLPKLIARFTNATIK